MTKNVLLPLKPLYRICEAGSSFHQFRWCRPPFPEIVCPLEQKLQHTGLSFPSTVENKSYYISSLYSMVLFFFNFAELFKFFISCKIMDIYPTSSYVVRYKLYKRKIWKIIKLKNKSKREQEVHVIRIPYWC